MNHLTDQQLLREYARHRVEDAFAELVRRHVDLVYSAALRLVRDPHQAEDVTQSVFVSLAQNTRQVSDHPVLSGWLHCTTRNLAVKSIRTDARRRAREEEAVMNELFSSDTGADWRQISSHLDVAMADLNAPDRDALLLRYFERKSAQEMAQTLGISSEAAQKRVNRAVDRLREVFIKRGITIGAGGLVVAISTNAVQSAPAGLTANVSLAAASAAISTTTFVAAKTIVMTTFQKTLLAAALAICVTVPLVIEHRAQTKLRTENSLLREQLQEQFQLAADNQRLSNLLDQLALTNSSSLPNDQLKELLRLRSEVGRLRATARELAQLKVAAGAADGGPAARLWSKLEQMPEKGIPEMRLLDEKKWAEDAAKASMEDPDSVREALAKLRRAAKMRFAMRMGSALNDYLLANNGQLPNGISELKTFFRYPADEPSPDDAVFQRYELLHVGKLSDLPPGEALIGEKAAVDDEFDTLFKIGTNSYSMQGTGKWSNQPGYTNLWSLGAPAN